jgi:hypothetical protein
MLKRILIVILVLVVIVGAFVLYSMIKVRLSPSVSVAPTASVRSSDIYRHVEFLSVRIGSRSVDEGEQLDAARDYILSVLRELGVRYALQDFTYRDRVYSNIIVTIEGGSDRDEVVLIGAHYDTVAGTPGADDNASAVAVLLEMCRLLKDDRLRRTLKLVFFTLEEPPVFRSEFMGSAVYARSARERKEDLRAMISLEMLGYYSDREGGQSFPLPFMHALFSSTPSFIAVVGNLASRSLVRQAAASLGKSGNIPVEHLSTFGVVPGVDFSDHMPFWDNGYHAVMITDTAFFRNPNYHTERDRIGTLDFRRMAALLDGLVEVARDLAGRSLA